MSIDINYFSFSPSRADKEWRHFKKNIVRLRQKYKDWEKEGTGDYKLLKDRIDKEEGILFQCGMDYLFSDDEYNERSLEYAMKRTDLVYGSAKNDEFESGKEESFLLEAV
ncbi:MAG: hypothetical protein ABII25_09315, partial [bacterium]